MYHNCYVINPSSKHKYTCVFLHPMSNNSSYFNEFIAYFKSHRKYKLLFKRIKFIFPHAPFITIDYPNNKLYNIQSWYNYYTCYNGISKIDNINVNQYRFQSSRIVNIINHEAHILNFKYKNIYLGGVSQGGTLIFDILNNLPCNIGALFCIKSIYMDKYTKFKKMYNKTPIFIYSGKKDTIYNVRLQNKCFKKLQKRKFNVIWHLDKHQDHFYVGSYEHYFIIKNMLNTIL